MPTTENETATTPDSEEETVTRSTRERNMTLTLDDVLEKTRLIGLSDDEVVETAMAVYVSKDIADGNPLWLLIVGNPSSNKTELLNLLSEAPDTYRLDVMTSNPFISGSSNEENPRDLLPELEDQCFIVKDYTSFFGRSDDTVRQLLSDMVSIYDGEFSKHSPLRGTVRYQCNFSHIGAVTPLGLSRRQKYMNMVGARFLTLRIPALSTEQQSEGFDITWNNRRTDHRTEAVNYASDFVTSICNSIREHDLQLEDESEEIKQQLNSIAQLIASARGEIHATDVTFRNDEGEQITYREITEVQIEEPFRALHQLKTFVRSLAVIRGKTEVGAEEIATAKRIALSSMPVSRADALSVFQWSDEVTVAQAADRLSKVPRTVRRHLDELHSLNILVKQQDESDERIWNYSPHPSFESLLLPQEDML